MTRPTFLSKATLGRNGNRYLSSFVNEQTFAPSSLNKINHVVRYLSSSNENLNNEGLNDDPNAPSNEKKYEPRRVQISFMTDVEGDAAYFNRFIEQSQILDFAPDGSVRFLHNPDNEALLDSKEHDLQTMFVYGGDSCDKGGSDLYVIQQLISLRERYGPERVHFVLGNRDINKMRITQELGSNIDYKKKNNLVDDIPVHKGIWWLKGRERVGDPISTEENHQVPTNAGDRLKWMLGKTMGSPNAFEYRRQELMKERASIAHRNKRGSDDIVTDDDVVRSYIQSCRPEGLVGQLINYGSVVVKIGSVLFMHGGLPITEDLLEEQAKLERNNIDLFALPYWKESTLPLPWLTSNDKKNPEISKITDTNDTNDTNKWITRLQNFHRNEIQSWKYSFSNDEKIDNSKNHSEIWATDGGYNNPKNGTSLMQYGMGFLPGVKKNPTVVYESWASYGMPKIISPPTSPFFDKPHQYFKLVQDFFMVSDVELIVTGHQPHGDLPIPMQIPYSSGRKVDTKVKLKESGKKLGWLMSCDTSFSGDTHWLNTHVNNVGRGDVLSGRGEVAISEVIIEQNLETGVISKIFSHGVLSEGSSYQSKNLMQIEGENNWVGKVIDQDSFTIMQNEDEESLDKIYDLIKNENIEKWWVKSRLNDDTYIVSSGKFHDVWNIKVTIP